MDDILLENQAQEIARELAALKSKQKLPPTAIPMFANTKTTGTTGKNVSVSFVFEKLPAFLSALSSGGIVWSLAAYGNTVTANVWSLSTTQTVTLIANVEAV